jgi:hypothetical protein
MQVRLFEYAVILQPKEDKDGEEVEPGKLLVEPTTVLARDPDQAGMIAARAIPEDAIDKLDRLSVVVRPF